MAIPNISKYQYIRIEGEDSEYHSTAGFTKINSDGTFVCRLIKPYGGFTEGDYKYCYCLNITKGKISGNNLTLMANGSITEACGCKGIGQNVQSIAEDCITIRGIMCMGMK